MTVHQYDLVPRLAARTASTLAYWFQMTRVNGGDHAVRAIGMTDAIALAAGVDPWTLWEMLNSPQHESWWEGDDANNVEHLTRAIRETQEFPKNPAGGEVAPV
jgi:hypothetical protein